MPARTGAYGGQVTRATLSTIPVGILEALNLNHRTRQRIKARLYATGTGPIYVRVAYRIGSGPWTRNPWAQLQGLSAFHELDLGIVRPNPDAGTLTVRIEAYSDTAGDVFDVDVLYLIPVAKYAKARGATPFGPAATLSASDGFAQAAGALTGKTLEIGGTWAGAGDADDFNVDGAGVVTRTAVSDAAGWQNARLVTASTPTLAATAARVDMKASALAVGAYQGLLLRYVDASNFLIINIGFGASITTLGVDQRVAAANTTLGTRADFPSAVNTWVTLSALVTASGTLKVWLGVPDAALGTPDITATSTALATGGALDDGKVGIFDWKSTATAATRSYDNFSAFVPEEQHVIAASGAVVLDHESIARSDGTRPPDFEGSYLKAPPAGREDRTSRLVVKVRRNDVDEVPDDNIADGQEVDVTATPRVSLI